jgi:hypothetical protein
MCEDEEAVLDITFLKLAMPNTVKFSYVYVERRE